MLAATEYLERSQARLETAHHLLSVTYPSTHSVRLLLSTVEHLFLAMDYAMNAVLVQHSQKLAQKEHAAFSTRYALFRLKLANKLGFQKKSVDTLLKLRNTLLEHQRSPVEFERNNCFVICSDEYKMTILSMETVSEFISTAKDFVQTAKIAAEESLSTTPSSR
jgi:hypothetical protein